MIKEAKKTTPSKAERLRQEVVAAMPEVRELVKKHGITRIQSCLTRLREYDKTQRKAEELRAKADELERGLEGEKVRLRA